MSVLFKDLNEGCTKTVRECVERCDGTTYEICKEVPLPYFQAHPVYPPTFTDVRESNFKPCGGKVLEVCLSKFGRLTFRSNVVVSAGSIIKFGKNNNEYHIKTVRYVLPKGGWRYLIERVDGSDILDVDLEIIKNNTFKVAKRL